MRRDLRNAPDAPPRKRQHGRFVYFISDGQAIKIGRARCVRERLSQLQTSHHAPLRVLASFFGDSDDEYSLHGYFGHLRLRGEWFRSDPELLDFIEVLHGLSDYLYQRKFTILEVVQRRHVKIVQRESMMRNAEAADARGFTRFLDEHKGTMSPELFTKARRAQLSFDMIRMNRNNPVALERAIQMSAPDLTAFSEAWKAHGAAIGN